MKTMLHFKIFITVVLFTIGQQVAAIQEYNGSKSLNKSSEVPANVTLQFQNRSGDIKIYTTSGNTVLMNTTVEITGNSKEDVDKVLSAIENFKFELQGDVLSIDTRFYKNMNSVNNRSTMTLLNGDKVKIKNFKIRHELQIPKSAGLNLDNKYSDIEMQSLDGKAKLVIYNSKLDAEDFANNLGIESKYSKIKVNSVSGDANFDFYDSDIELKSCANIDINTKYSKYEIAKAENMTVDSYDDKFSVNELKSLSFVSKYSDFMSDATVNNVKLDLYDCNIRIKSAISGSYNGKYSDLKLGDINELKISQSYDDDIYLGKTADIQISDSKYSKYEVGGASLFTIKGYNDEVKINNLASGFSGINVDGKYEKLNIYAGSVPFRVDFKIKYPKVDIPESVKITKKIKENEDLELVGGETGGKINVEGYDIKVVISD